MRCSTLRGMQCGVLCFITIHTSFPVVFHLLTNGITAYHYLRFLFTSHPPTHRDSSESDDAELINALIIQIVLKLDASN